MDEQKSKDMLVDSLQREGRFRERLSAALTKHLLSADLPASIKFVILGILACALLFSVLVTLLLLHVAYGVIENVQIDFELYLYAFLGVAAMLFLIVILFGRRAVEYEQFSRTAEGFRQATRARGLDMVAGL